MNPEDSPVSALAHNVYKFITQFPHTIRHSDSMGDTARWVVFDCHGLNMSVSVTFTRPSQGDVRVVAVACYDMKQSGSA